VRRITTGSGSARLQAISPDGRTGLHLTQSALPPGYDIAAAMVAVRAAVDREAPGTFTDLDRTEDPAGRPAIGYREHRTDRQIRWTLLIDGSVRIAVGCEAPPDRLDLVQSPCDAAVRSAHAVF
jgi:type VII secretion-associated protein (TIGR03931 family)